MGKWTMYPILNRGFQVKVYVNEANDTAVVFPLFGKYYVLRSDVSALDFATDFIIDKPHNNVVSFESYLSQFEDTAIIYVDKVA